MGRRTSIVKRCEDTRWSTFFNEVTDDLVIEVLDWCPLDLFSDVFFLFRFQCKFNEDLLQLFINVIDAKLFE